MTISYPSLEDELEKNPAFPDMSTHADFQTLRFVAGSFSPKTARHHVERVSRNFLTERPEARRALDGQGEACCDGGRLRHRFTFPLSLCSGLLRLLIIFYTSTLMSSPSSTTL
jgi:hypothetical protein